jgi:hypothetical protein
MRWLFALIAAVPALLICTGTSAQTDSLNFPVRGEATVRLADDEYRIYILDLPGKESYGFAWAAMRDGYLLKIEYIDGQRPEIVANPTANKNQFGIQYKAGGHQSVLDVIALSQDGLVNITHGRISSGWACIVSDSNGDLLSYSTDNRKIYVDRFRVAGLEVKRVSARTLAVSKADHLARECREKSYFRDDWRK